MPLNFVAKAAITVALTAANMALTMSRKIEGPRLDDLKSTGADYGTPLYMIWGMRRVEVPIFWAEELKEVKRRRKTKGGKYNEYTYYGSWAVAVAGHEIAGVSRIWFDTHLIYDLSGAGPVTPFDFGSGDIASKITIYRGTEDQDPDPRIDAWCTARYGEDSCPAYRGTAYIVFKDIPLEKIGNRIPQVSVEVVSVDETNYPYETFPTETAQPARLWGFTFATDYSRFMWSDGTNYEIWDTAARAQIINGTFPVELALQDIFGMRKDGSFYATGEPFPSIGRQKIYLLSADGAGSGDIIEVPDVAHIQGAIRVRADGNGDEHWLSIPYSSNRWFYVDSTPFRMMDITGVDWSPTEFFTKQDDGSIWAVGRTPGTGSTAAYFKRILGSSDEPGFFMVSGLPAIGIALGAVTGCFSAGHFILCWRPISGADCLYKIDPLDGSIVASRVDLSLDVYNTDKQFANLPPGSTSIWLNESEISLSDLSTIRTATLSDWKVEDADGSIYDPVNHALICAPQFSQVLTFRYLDRFGEPGIDLGDICADVAGWVGVGSHDFSALNQQINGWSATRGQASNMLEPLLDAYDADVRPHDWIIQGVKRTGVATGATLATERFAGNPRYTVKVKQAAELPRSLTIDFADINGDQQPNSARVARPLDATDARGEQKLDLTTLALSADTAIQLAGRFFRRLWNERKQPMLALTAQNIGLEPGDVRTLELDGTEIAARATRVVIKADETIETEWRYDNPSLATLDGSAGAAFAGRDPSVISVPLLSKGFFLDIPLLADADASAKPLIYFTAGPYADGSWPGAVAYQAIDGEYSEEIASVPSSSPAAWGYVDEAMPYANPNLWDRGTELTVKLQTGELTGCTEAEANANPSLNLIAIGNNGRWELLQFTNAELVSGKTYTVSGFKRGRRGTEWAAELHEVRDAFVLLDMAQDVAFGLSDVGTELSFKAITSGRTDGFAVTLSDFEGNSLKPYAPAHLTAVKDPATGDWTFSWVRRTRVGGAWTSGTTIPLGEASEGYHLTVGDGVSSAVKTVTTPTYVWDVATQTTDTGGEVMAGALAWSVAQISDAVGDGFLAAA